MFRRFYLWSAIALLVFGSIAGLLSTWFTQEVSAANENVGLENIEDLDVLDLDFGATQNSLILNLDGSSGQNRIDFTLTEVFEKTTRGRSTATTEVELKYIADFQPNLAFNLREPQTSSSTTRNSRNPNRSSSPVYSLPSFCEQQSTIRLTSEKTNHGNSNGYDQDWKNFNLHNKQLQAHLIIPIFNASTESVSDDCFILEEQLSFKNSENKPLFALIGNNFSLDTCSGLKIHGRGGDDLEKTGVEWFCRDDVSSEGEERDKFSVVESPPFDSYYIFIENRTDSDDCGGRILIDKSNFSAGETILEGQWQDWHNDCRDGQFDQGKDQKRITPIIVFNTFRLPSDSDNDAVSGDGVSGENVFTAGDTGVSGDPSKSLENSCELQWSGFGFGWIVCWIAKAVSDALNWIESKILEDFLAIKRSDYTQEFEGGLGKFTYKDAWRNIRNIVTLAIVGTALFMVLSTALDFGFFSNYTVKKYLPRLVIGTILIQFSWVLGDILIQATNQIGDLAGALLFAGFPGAEDHGLDKIFGEGGFISLFTGIAGGAAAYSIGLTFFLPIGVSALSMFFFGFLFLFARKYIIILLLILAPLGLAFWILPGNDKAWNFYVKTFLYLLLFYPLVVISISAGKIFSYLILL